MHTFPSALKGSIALIGAAALVAGCGGGGDGDDNVGVAQACDQVRGKTIAGADVVAAADVAASGAQPRHCRVSATIAPALNLELRLPQDWNGKLYYGGGGGYNGAIPALAGGNLAALNKGYATVNSDSGHQGSVLSAEFALDDRAAAELFGHKSVPTVMASATGLLKTAYGKAPKRAYFEGCSNGGREALMAAQRNPELFDGIIARAPAYNWVGVMGAFNRTAKRLAEPGGQLGAAKIALLASSVRAACDGLDGIADGVVSNAAACTAARFDVQSLRCSGGGDTGDSCLSDAQLAVVDSWTTPASFVAGTYGNAGWALTGNEDDPGAWPAWVTGSSGSYTSALQYLFQDTTVKYYLARDADADSIAYAWESKPTALATMASLNDATDPDLRPFRQRGGKLILWHGMNDAALSWKATAAYYGDVVTAVGGSAKAESFMRLYLAPGVNHCAGGPGADSTDLLDALDQWVVAKVAPGTLNAAHGEGATPEFSRPLCRYPQYPRYTGPANDAAAARQSIHYTCTTP